jgi:ADP-heptose:LPS heptosyltransferase
LPIAVANLRAGAKKKVLAINFGGIGDEILFLPTLESIRKAVPDCHVTLLLEPRSRSVEQVSQLIDRTVTFDIKKRPLYVADLIQLLGLIRDGGYDLVVSSGSSKVVSILLFLSGIPVRVGYHSGKLSEILLTSPVALNKEQYAANMYHDLATGLGAAVASATECIPSIDVREESLQRMMELLETNATAGKDSKIKRVIIHPGTSKLAIEKGIIKTWHPQNWAKLIQLLADQGGVEILLAGGPDDAEIVAEIIKLAPKKAPLINCYGKTKSLADLAALMHLSDLLVCVDSAPMHLGVGLRKPMVALFGPTEVKKLLPNDVRFKALQGTISGAATSGSGSQPQDERGVQLQPNTVFRSVQDQLKAATDRGS